MPLMFAVILLSLRFTETLTIAITPLVTMNQVPALNTRRAMPAHLLGVMPLDDTMDQLASRL